MRDVVFGLILISFSHNLISCCWWFGCNCIKDKTNVYACFIHMYRLMNADLLQSWVVVPCSLSRSSQLGRGDHCIGDWFIIRTCIGCLNWSHTSVIQYIAFCNKANIVLKGEVYIQLFYWTMCSTAWRSG